jgi:dienelactone hydrolase
MDVVSQFVRENGLVGTFFHPAEVNLYPGILILGGSSGTIREQDAAILAAQGYCTLALAYFGREQLSPALVEIPLEYFETALQWLQSSTLVKSDAITVIGTSKGAEAALLLGATFPVIKAVVGYAPSAVVFEGLGTTESEFNKSSWSYHGQPLPFVPVHETPAFAEYVEACKQQNKPIACRSLYSASLQDTARLKQATIEVEKINGPVLLISGQDDQMWPSALFGNMIEQRLVAFHHPYPYKHLVYEQAGHKIGIPGTNQSSSRRSLSGLKYDYGGTVEGNARASADSWRELLTFLK